MAVRMRHPDLDSEYLAEPGQVPHLEQAGWVQVEGQDEQGEVWPEDLQLFDGQQQVRMRHPDLPGQEIVRAESAVPYHRERGWQVIEDTPPSDENAPSSDAQAEGRSEPTVAELREQAKAAGISPLPTTKADLLAALRDQPNQQSQQEPTAQEGEE